MKELNIRNMVCDRCIKSVSTIFQQMRLAVESIALGKVVITKTVSSDQMIHLKEMLKAEGFELIDDARIKQVEMIKNLIVSLVHYGEMDELKENLSTYLSGKLHRDYNYISNLFSSIENYTIEQFFILQKIEKIKEWLVYDEMTLSEMSFRMGYSSVAHLSSQFKKITGFTPSQFKKLKDHHRKSLDKL